MALLVFPQVVKVEAVLNKNSYRNREASQRGPNKVLLEVQQDTVGRGATMTDDQQGRLEEAARAQLVKAMRLNVGEDMFVAMFKAGAAWMKADIEANRDLTVEYLVGYSQGKADEAERLAKALKKVLSNTNGDA